jgi:hypothetical protein
LRPAIGHTRPRSVISPVMATSRCTEMPVITETIAVAMATPAEGPSFGEDHDIRLNFRHSNYTHVRTDNCAVISQSS